MEAPPTAIGLVVNPVAGLGGPAGLKGSDAPGIRALARVGSGVADVRAAQALEALAPLRDRLRLLTGAGELGAGSAARAGWVASAVGALPRGARPTTAADTRAVARALHDAGVALLLVAGGDGTLVDVLRAVGDRVPVLGIPAGVKMQSGAFALSPRTAGRAAAAFLADPRRTTEPAEVADLDEAALRHGTVAPRLLGVVRVPAVAGMLQSPKQRSPAGEVATLAELGSELCGAFASPDAHVVGPGTTTAALLAAAGLRGTVLGVDVVRASRIVAADVDRAALERAVEGADVRVVVAPIGGQGFLFGRGNQQISPAVLERAGPAGLVVVATERKLAGLQGRPLLLDCGDDALDRRLAATGYVRVLTGRRRSAFYPVAAAA